MLQDLSLTKEALAFFRIIDFIVDIGAYEFGGNLIEQIDALIGCICVGSNEFSVKQDLIHDLKRIRDALEDERFGKACKLLKEFVSLVRSLEKQTCIDTEECEIARTACSIIFTLGCFGEDGLPPTCKCL